jgi:large subunit ribosomal protein L31
MKADIHPTYYEKAIATCACGATYTVGSTLEKIEVEICAACHPFYTGLEKVLDTTGRVDKFKKRAAASAKKA